MSSSLYIPKTGPAKDVSIAVESIGEDSSISLSEAEKILSREERRRAAAFQFEVHRRRYMRGRAWLRKKLGEWLSQRPEKIQLDTEKLGKPFLPGEDLAFNVSHSAEIACYAFSRNCKAVGVDIELLDRKADIESLRSQCLTVRESKLFDEVAPAEQAELFFRIWTAKEARMKLSGEGLLLDPLDIELEFEDNCPIGYRKPDPEGIHLYSFEIDDFNAVGAVAFRK